MAIFGIRREKQLAREMETVEGHRSYFSILTKQFRKNKPAVWSLRILFLLVFIGVFSNFIANEKPLYCKIDGEVYFPVFKEVLVNLGIGHWESKFVIQDWHKQEYESVIFPLIPYSSTTLDRKNMGYVGPFEKQRVNATRFRHWLGTDQLGRDVAAGLIAGTRIALLVGIISMTIAAIIGIFLGSIAGYFGDSRFKISRIRLWLNIIGLMLGIFIGFSARAYALTSGNFGIELLKSIGLTLLILGGINLLVIPLRKLSWLGKRIKVPLDLLVMRFIEIMNSIPTLLFILSVVAVIEKQSILYIMAIIGLIRWTGIARFIRAELLRVRRLEYIEAAEALGYSNWRIITRHAIPNALTPVLITIAFGIASAILLEAYLSFLSIGVPPDQVTWGSLLREARNAPSAWWIGLFPGMAIFITVTIFNLLGEGLTDALDPRKHM